MILKRKNHPFNVPFWPETVDRILIFIIINDYIDLLTEDRALKKIFLRVKELEEITRKQKAKPIDTGKQKASIT